MEVRILGGVEVVTGEVTVAIEAPRHRAVLAVLALDGGPVSEARLVDAIWGDDPPERAGKTLQGYVSALRRDLGHDVIETVPTGYRLGAGVQVDLDDAERHLARARSCAAVDPATARREFQLALSRWRGLPLSDLAPGAVRAAETARLDELHLLAVEGRIEADLALGHHREVVPDLQRLVIEHPYREALWRLLFLSLHRSGRDADAIIACRRLRSVLADELGVDPSAETSTLESRILGRDPVLDLDTPLPPNNLTVPLDTFVDRERERDEITQVLRSHRLVTLVGPGGVGKSRLASELAHELLSGATGGAWWIDLAEAEGDDAVTERVAAALDVPAPAGVPLVEVLLSRLQRPGVLVVLDNCEHVMTGAAAFARAVTERDTRATVLATSRSPLGVPGEYQVALAPLSFARSGDDLSDAGRLFVDRVSAAGTGAVDHDVVTTITELVGGLPLGIELAAAQCQLRAPAQIASALGERGGLLAMSSDHGDVDDRHASLGRVLGDSFDALPPATAEVCPRLSVFPGTFDEAAAAMVLDVAPDAVASHLLALLDASLLVTDASDPGRRRFRLLRPVREYLAGELTDDARAASVEHHARHFHTVAVRFLEVYDAAGEQAWLDRARRDWHNLRRAIGWFERHEPTRALDFGPGTGAMWQTRGDQAEGRVALRRLLAIEGAGTLTIAATEEELGWLEFLGGDFDRGLTLLRSSRARFEAIDHPRGLARALRGEAHALHLTAAPTSITRPLYERSLEVAAGASLPFSTALTEVHFAHSLAADESEAPDAVERMLAHAEAELRPHDHAGVLAHLQLSRCFLALTAQRLDDALAAAQEMLRLSRLAGVSVWEQIALVASGYLHHHLGEHSASRSCLHDAVHLALDTGNIAQFGIALHTLAATLGDRSPEQAARLRGAADTIVRLWPLHARLYGHDLAPARRQLGERWPMLLDAGAAMSRTDVVAAVDRETRAAPATDRSR